VGVPDQGRVPRDVDWITEHVVGVADSVPGLYFCGLAFQ
jgi:hypothetical protein